MQNLKEEINKETKEMVIKLDLEHLSHTQKRLIKSITGLLSHLLTADNESEYFESSSILMKKVAEFIKSADYANQGPSKGSGISYGDQAVEFAVDFLNESIDGNKIQNIDN